MPVIPILDDHMPQEAARKSAKDFGSHRKQIGASSDLYVVRRYRLPKRIGPESFGKLADLFFELDDVAGEIERPQVVQEVV